MNKARREALDEIYDTLALLAERLEELIDEENEILDYIPENLQGSARYRSAKEAVSNLKEALDNLGSAYDLIEEAITA